MTLKYKNIYGIHHERTAILTSDSPVYNVDSLVQHIAASSRNLANNSHLSPVLLGGRGLTSKLRPTIHSESMRVHSQKVCSKKFILNVVSNTESSKWTKKMQIRENSINYFAKKKKKQPIWNAAQTMKEPPLCFSDGCIFALLDLCPGFCTSWRWFSPKISHLDPSTRHVSIDFQWSSCVIQHTIAFFPKFSDLIASW